VGYLMLVIVLLATRTHLTTVAFGDGRGWVRWRCDIPEVAMKWRRI
jgi:hypothetical protein